VGLAVGGGVTAGAGGGVGTVVGGGVAAGRGVAAAGRFVGAAAAVGPAWAPAGGVVDEGANSVADGVAGSTSVDGEAPDGLADGEAVTATSVGRGARSCSAATSGFRVLVGPPRGMRPVPKTALIATAAISDGSSARARARRDRS
jgi:hypothetical protein